MAQDEGELGALDPRGLIAEAYRIEGISPQDCRTIFFDWALGPEPSAGDPEACRRLHAHYEALHPTHPMTLVLAEGLSSAARVGGRRGRAGRR